ncbi:hypothetical protein [Mycolicibacter minnesotensis]
MPDADQLRTPEERDAVTAYLNSKGGVWTARPPNYAEFSREQLLRNLEDVAQAVTSETDSDQLEVKQAYLESETFVHASFDYFEGRRDLGRSIARAFCVPMRSARSDESSASESTPFFSLYDPDRFGVTSAKRMRGMYGMPPTVLDAYTKSDRAEEAGALVLVPLYSDMLNDIWPERDNLEQGGRVAAIVSTVLCASANFAHHRLGAKVLGLGATLPHPTLTNFGRTLRAIDGMHDLVTTTGHGGTVFMIIKTIEKVLSETSIRSNGIIGLIGGAGSIGWSTIVAALEAFPDHTIYTYDKRLVQLKEYSTVSDRICVVTSIEEVLRPASVIVAAVTERIDLDGEPLDQIDLSGKVVIDDSQPGSFCRNQVEARGGALVWVVGEDASDSGYITRDGLHTNGIPYNYGDNAGLYGMASEFACGQEAAVIAKYQAYDSAVAGPVTPNDVRRVGALFEDSGVQVAPFQSFGQPVIFR